MVGLLRSEQLDWRSIMSERQWVLPVALARHGDERIDVSLILTAPAGFSPAAGPSIASPRPALRHKLLLPPTAIRPIVHLSFSEAQRWMTLPRVRCQERADDPVPAPTFSTDY